MVGIQRGVQITAYGDPHQYCGVDEVMMNMAVRVC